MLAYAASRPVVVDRRPHPNAMLVIVAAHVAAVAALMSAKMDLHHRVFDPPTVIEFIKLAPPPQPTITPATERPATAPTPPTLDRPADAVVLPPVDRPVAEPRLPPVDLSGVPGATVSVTPAIPKPPLPGIKSGAQLLTPEAERKPPYPASKLLNEEEALLTLRLTIDDRGRVVAVDPLGRADPAFLESARRHLIAHWRYKPATEDGRAVPSSMVIRLRFELDG